MTEEKTERPYVGSIFGKSTPREEWLAGAEKWPELYATRTFEQWQEIEEIITDENGKRRDRNYPYRGKKELNAIIVAMDTIPYVGPVYGKTTFNEEVAQWKLGFPTLFKVVGIREMQDLEERGRQLSNETNIGETP